MDSNYTNNPTLEEIAGYSSLTPTHFQKVFKKYFGLSPRRYMLNKRLSDAKSLLLNSNKSIKCIAEMAGYENNFYFSKVFKDEYGISPKQYRDKGNEY